MKTLTRIIVLSFILLFFSCGKEDGVPSEGDYLSDTGAENGNGAGAGLMTAGEWNDIDNWDFWTNLLNGQEFSSMPEYWKFYTNNRICVYIKNNEIPLINVKVELIRNGVNVWTTLTDNFGHAELWISLYQKESLPKLEDFSIKVNEQLLNLNLTLFEKGINQINLDLSQENLKKIELSFIVDATGSMGDELEFLKADLKNVINSIKNSNSDISILTSAVFYRDEGDDYVTRKSDFTSDLDKTINFIGNQSAGGGGDFPEAVHTALNVGINELQWSSTAKTRIAFLILDAPPHYTTAIVEKIHNLVASAAAKGIKIIPITASGIDKETEFLMRFMAIATNGTYVFITNDSGIGNDHIMASVGEYQVEYLNDLIVRLITKYSK